MRLFVFLPLAQLWAASSAEVEGHPVSIINLVFPLINFLIFLYLMKRFLLPLIKNHLRSRRAEILGAVKRADEGKERMEAMLRDYRDRLAHLDEESKKIRETLRMEGERERAKVLTEAEGIALRIRAGADFLAQQEVKVARQQVREEIARIAQAAAERAIQDHFRTTDQERLVEEFLKRMGETR
ncbi:MAG: hypothetical protein ACE5JU_06715 [Candidatus Binatia bacterium]